MLKVIIFMVIESGWYTQYLSTKKKVYFISHHQLENQLPFRPKAAEP
jgi:hypothetical protein